MRNGDAMWEPATLTMHHTKTDGRSTQIKSARSAFYGKLEPLRFRKTESPIVHKKS